MAKYAAPIIWTDEFNTPSIEGLRGLIELDAKKAFDKARSKIMSLGEEIIEDIHWFGDCWFWSITYSIPNLEDPLVILIPSPEDLQMAAPLNGDFLNQLSTRRLKRFVRDGIELAMPPHMTNWAIWSTPTPPAVEDVMPVIKNKYKFYATA